MTLGWRHWSTAFAVALLLHIVLFALQWSRGESARERAVVTLDLQTPSNLPEPVPVSLPSSLAFAWQLGAEPEADQPLPDNIPQPRPAKRANLSATLGGQSLGLEALTQPAVVAAAGASTQQAASPAATSPEPRRAVAQAQAATPAPSSQPSVQPPAQAGPAPPNQVRLVQREPDDEPDDDREDDQDDDQPAAQPQAAEPRPDPALTIDPSLELASRRERVADTPAPAPAPERAREDGPGNIDTSERASPTPAPAPSDRNAQARPEPPNIDQAIEQALAGTARVQPRDVFPPPTVTPEPVPQPLPPPPRRRSGADIDQALSDTLDQLARAPAPRNTPPVEYRLPTPEFRPEPEDRAPRRNAPNRNAEISRALSGVESHFGQREGGPALPPPPPVQRQQQAVPPASEVESLARRSAPTPERSTTGPAQADRGQLVDRRYAPSGRPGAFSVNADDFFSRIAEHIFASNDRFVGRLPEDARRLVLDVRFTIDRAGRVMRVDLVSSSGDPRLDQAAKDVVWRASPMPQMAQDMISETLELTFPVIVAR